MKYHVIVFGCQMNISDSERVSAVLERMEYKKTSDPAEADLIVVVMCSIRQSAVDRVHGLVHSFEKIKKTNPDLKTVLTGCVLKRDRKKFLDGFDYVIDIKNIKKLPRVLRNVTNHNLRDSVKNDVDEYLNVEPKYSSTFSAPVPIMTGCNNFCAYCVVPYARQQENSRPAKKIISEIKKLAKIGYKEIWLLGQNVNSYSNVLENNRIVTFPNLLRTINNIPGNFWIRFTSSHPKDFNTEVIDAMAVGGKITPYLNLPVQSGDDKVLKSMNRRYTVKEYKNKINELRKKIPNICVSTDIIVGFPGETKKQFENSVKLFEDVKFDMAYISEYSERKGTAAAKMKDDVPHEEKTRRKYVLNEVLKKTALEQNQKYIGKKVTALISGKDFKNNWIGKTEEYKTIQIKSAENLLGKFIKAKITGANSWKLEGKLL